MFLLLSDSLYFIYLEYLLLRLGRVCSTEGGKQELDITFLLVNTGRRERNDEWIDWLIDKYFLFLNKAEWTKFVSTN
jgi:hypothetical protein